LLHPTTNSLVDRQIKAVNTFAKTEKKKQNHTPKKPSPYKIKHRRKKKKGKRG
jgi:peptide methionine sulfoxide reductase MsrA